MWCVSEVGRLPRGRYHDAVLSRIAADRNSKRGLTFNPTRPAPDDGSATSRHTGALDGTRAVSSFHQVWQASPASAYVAIDQKCAERREMEEAATFLAHEAVEVAQPKSPIAASIFSAYPSAVGLM